MLIDTIPSSYVSSCQGRSQCDMSKDLNTVILLPSIQVTEILCLYEQLKQRVATASGDYMQALVIHLHTYN